jgi:hypothetical protein
MVVGNPTVFRAAELTHPCPSCNKAAGPKIMPWRWEEALRERGAEYVQGALFKAFAVRDG